MVQKKKSPSRQTKRKAGRPMEGQEKDLKNRILKSFFELAFEEGVGSVTLQKVADRSQVAFTTVRYHFNIQGHSLSEVALNELLQHAYQFIEQGITQLRAHPDFDPVDSYIQVMFDWIEREPVFTSYLAYFYYLSTTKLELPFQNRILVETAQRRIQTLMHEGLGMGMYSYKGDTWIASQQIHSMVMGGFIIGNTSRQVEALKSQRENCRIFARTLLTSNFIFGAKP
jgi:AcrR family transcriptional regulator